MSKRLEREVDVRSKKELERLWNKLAFVYDGRQQKHARHAAYHSPDITRSGIVTFFPTFSLSRVCIRMCTLYCVCTVLTYMPGLDDFF